jgi:hypothetical protein
MLHGFPIPHGDELFYSLMARYADRQSYPSRKTILCEAFGATTVVATVEFPSRLAAFAAKFPATHPCAKPDLLEKHTLLPWYAPFLPNDRVERLRNGMLANGGGRASALVGLQASRVRVPLMLRFCPQCFREDRNAGRELYWRRLHQLTGIDVCPIHRVHLEASPIRRVGRVTRHAFLLPGATLAQHPPRPLTDADEPLLRVARLGEQLLIGNWPILGLEAIHRNLMGLLAEAGFTTLGGNVRARELARAVTAFYPKDYLERVNGSDTMHWLERLVHSPRGVQAPIRYLLILAMVGLDLKRLLGEEPTTATPKKYPTCHNSVCPGDDRPMVLAETVVSADVGGPVDLFRCMACGQIMARCSVGHERQWIRNYGPVWREELAIMWNDPKNSLLSIARRLNVDPMTVKRQAMKAGLKFPRCSKRLTTTRGLEDMLRSKPDRVSGLRQKWLSVREAHPARGAKALRSKFPALYASLYRVDREWLITHKPPKAKRVARSRVDWPQRDERLLPVVKAVALELRLQKGRPRQITTTAVLRAAGKESWLSKLTKLPKSREMLAQLVEDREGFACRRVWRVKHETSSNGHVLRLWELQQRARLRPDLMDRSSVKKALVEALADSN